MLLYKLFLFCYPKIAKLLGLFNPKAKQWAIGQDQVWEEIAEKQKLVKGHPIVWIHAASYGEFEQGLPIIEAIKLKYPDYKIWLTFFSPSGYLHRKNDPSVDVVTYLPFDSVQNANEFIHRIQPKLIIFIKYEFWFNYLNEAKQKNIPAILVAALFRRNQIFFKWYGGFYKNLLNLFTYILVQDKISFDLASTIIDPNKLLITGDTRFDRVHTTAQELSTSFNWINTLNTKRLIIAGSTWPSDHALIQKTIDENLNVHWIIAPHHVDSKSIEQCKHVFKNSITLSELELRTLNNAKNIPFTNSTVIIVDRIGILRSLYQYAYISYIGGGFTKDGIHNVLEPAVFGAPIIWGSNDHKYREAIGLRNMGGGVQVNDANEFKHTIHQLLKDIAKHDTMGATAKKYIQDNLGASKKTIQLIQEKRLLTN